MWICNRILYLLKFTKFGSQIQVKLSRVVFYGLKLDNVTQVVLNLRTELGCAHAFHFGLIKSKNHQAH